MLCQFCEAIAAYRRYKVNPDLAQYRVGVKNLFATLERIALKSKMDETLNCNELSILNSAKNCSVHADATGMLDFQEFFKEAYEDVVRKLGKDGTEKYGKVNS